jgi:hypothetical protein
MQKMMLSAFDAIKPFKEEQELESFEFFKNSKLFFKIERIRMRVVGRNDHVWIDGFPCAAQ